MQTDVECMDQLAPLARVLGQEQLRDPLTGAAIARRRTSETSVVAPSTDAAARRHRVADGRRIGGVYCQPAALEAWGESIERARKLIGEPLAAAIAADLMYEGAIGGSPPAGGAVLLPRHVAGALLGALDVLAANAGGELAAVARQQAQSIYTASVVDDAVEQWTAGAAEHRGKRGNGMSQ